MISESSLKAKIESNMKNCGFVMTKQNKCLAASIAKAVVDEITQNAQVVVAGGSSSGTYKVS
jgi:hypothetical protein